MHGSRWDMFAGQVATKEVAVDHEIGQETAIRRKMKLWPKYPNQKMKLGKKQPFVAK